MQTSLKNWLEEASGPDYVWYAKRLSGNDTLANGAHQAGPYIPRNFLFHVFPSLNDGSLKNPDRRFRLSIASPPTELEVRVVWYNNKLHGNPKGGRNEARITNFGGKSSPLLDPENTGALAVFAFRMEGGKEADFCSVWVCHTPEEEYLIEDITGPIEPGDGRAWSGDESHRGKLLRQPRVRGTKNSCWLERDQIPAGWLSEFPKADEIIQHTLRLRPDHALKPDQRLMKRRECEFEIFRSLEQAMEMPDIRAGFGNIEDFLSKAQSILQRRKSRSGRSLELHAKTIFEEEGLRSGVDFAYGVKSEGDKRPDFLFPSQECYQDTAYSSEKLRMLAAKTTCKDRWRQILNEADRIPKKHLLTLQEGISEKQFQEMQKAGVQLVVPKPLVVKYPEKIRSELKTLEGFIFEIQMLKMT